MEKNKALMCGKAEMSIAHTCNELQIEATALMAEIATHTHEHIVCCRFNFDWVIAVAKSTKASRRSIGAVVNLNLSLTKLVRM